jgi:hypothetical protein
MSVLEQLLEQRRRIADEAFANVEIVGFIDADGWDISGDCWSRAIYCENPENADGDSILGSFGIRFKADISEVIEHWKT